MQSPREYDKRARLLSAALIVAGIIATPLVGDGQLLVLTATLRYY